MFLEAQIYDKLNERWKTMSQLTQLRVSNIGTLKI